MTKFSVAIAVALVATPLPAAADVLARAKWSDRLLVVCGADPGALAAGQQRLVDVDGYAERDLSLVVSSSDAVTWEKEGVCQVTPDAGVQALEGCSASPAQILLIGKDGRRKGRWFEPVTSDELFPLIDAMPMRAREMAR